MKWGVGEKESSSSRSFTHITNHDMTESLGKGLTSFLASTPTDFEFPLPTVH